MKRFEKVFADKLEGCYVASEMLLNGKKQIVFASETEKTGLAKAVDPDTFSSEVIMDGPGGCMGVVPLPERDGQFLAITDFYPVFQSEHSEVRWYKKTKDGYVHHIVALVPFTHRIGIIKAFGDFYLIIGQLCKAKAFTDDWSTAGSVYAGKINFAKEYIEDLRPIADGIFQNHGFTILPGEEKDSFLISGQCGVFCMTPEKTADGLAWKRETVLDTPASDAVAADIDGDGRLEYGVIAPFHGTDFTIYRRTDKGTEELYRLPGKHAFGHAIFGGTFEGKNVFLVGFRAGGEELYLIGQNQLSGKIEETLIDEGFGPTNVNVVASKKGDCICAADRQSDGVSVYRTAKPAD